MSLRIALDREPDDAMGRPDDEWLRPVVENSAQHVVARSGFDPHPPGLDMHADASVLGEEVQISAGAGRKADVDIAFTGQDLQWTMHGLIGKHFNASIGGDEFDRPGHLIHGDVSASGTDGDPVESGHLNDHVSTHRVLFISLSRDLDDDDGAPVVAIDFRGPGDPFDRIRTIGSTIHRVESFLGDLHECFLAGSSHECPNVDVPGKAVDSDRDRPVQLQWLPFRASHGRAAECGQGDQEHQQNGFQLSVHRHGLGL